VELSSSLQCLLRSFGHRFNRATSCTTLGRLPHIAPLTAYQNSKKWRCGWWVFPSRSCPQVCEIETKPEDPSQEPKDREESLPAALFFPCPNSASASEGLGSLLTESSSHGSGTRPPHCPTKGTTPHPRKYISEASPERDRCISEQKAERPWSRACSLRLPASLLPNRKRDFSAFTWFEVHVLQSNTRNPCPYPGHTSTPELTSELTPGNRTVRRSAEEVILLS
jgi:hypothetical protein